MIVRDRVKEGSDKATRDARALGIFSEDQLSGYGDDISFLLGVNVTSAKHKKKQKGKYGGHENYGHDDSTKSSLRL